MAAITVSNLIKRHKTTHAVDKLSLTVSSGTIYGLLGPNGAGKTTTMRMLTGLTRPTSGVGSVAGVSIIDRDGLRPRIGYLPEEPPIYEQVTAYEQLEYAAGLRDLPTEFIRERVDGLLDELGLTADASTRIANYSKGMRQKVAYIQAILHKPDVVFLDEPTAGVDPRAGRTIRETIQTLADEGTTVFLSTHILPVVEEIADTIGILYDGHLVAEDTPKALKQRAETEEKHTLEDVFLELTTDATTPMEAADG